MQWHLGILGLLLVWFGCIFHPLNNSMGSNLIPRNIQGANSLGWSTSPCASCYLSCRLSRCEGSQLGPPTARVCSSGRRDWVQAAEASKGDLELERRGEHMCKAPRARQGRTQGWGCAVDRRRRCWTDGDASEPARRMSDFLVGAPRVATRVSEIQYQCEGGPQRNRLVPSASSVSNEVKSLWTW